MLSFFKRKSLLSDLDREFQHACYAWLLKHFGGDDFYRDARLVLPTPEFFPTQVDSAHEAARTTFAQVKKHAGMEEWPCTLVAQEEDPDAVVGATLIIQNADTNPLGTFSANEQNQVTITYNPKLVNDPTHMVATFAHELSHYLTVTAAEPPPGGEENWEFATDICASFLGFGIFMANSAFTYRQYHTVEGHGWQSSGSGYLSEAEHSYALALFLNLKEIPIENALEYCDANIKSNLKRAQKELERLSIIEDLRRIEYQPPTA